MLDSSISPYEIDCQDSDEMRRKILAILYAEWKKMGFSKGTLFYLKKNARDGKPFTMNKHVRERLEQWEFSNGLKYLESSQFRQRLKPSPFNLRR